MKKGVVTVSNEEYIAGTKVLFYSFLKHHPNFVGDLIVIHHNLSTDKQEELSGLFDVKFVQISDAIIQAVATLVQEKKALKNRYQRFWSLEVFKLNQYDHLLFLDSDILCRGSLEPLFDLPYGVSACPDLSFYEGASRNRLSFQKVPSAVHSAENILKTFNAGLFSIRFSKLSPSVYTELLALLKYDVFSSVKSGHTDQYVLNVFFENKVNSLGVEYNYVLKNVKKVEATTGISAEEAVIWHYIRHPKPWKMRRIIKNRLKGIAIPPYWGEWHKTYRLILKESNRKRFKLKNVIIGLFSKVLIP